MLPALRQVRNYVYQQLAMQLRPSLEGVVKHNDVPAGTAYDFNSVDCARRSIRNMSESILGSLKEPAIQERLLQRYGTGRVLVTLVLINTS